MSRFSWRARVDYRTVTKAPPLPVANMLADASSESVQETSVARLVDAEDLLDWLESHGFVNRKVVALENTRFTVSWQSP